MSDVAFASVAALRGCSRRQPGSHSGTYSKPASAEGGMCKHRRIRLLGYPSPPKLRTKVFFSGILAPQTRGGPNGVNAKLTKLAEFPLLKGH